MEGEYILWVRLLILQILKKKKLNTLKIRELTLKMSDMIGDAELTEMKDGDILMDSVSEAKVKEIEELIHLEYLKAGYKIEEICL